MSRSKWWAMPVALVVPVLAVAVAPTPSAAQEATPAQTLTFNYTGDLQSWTVPADVNQATFDVYGAQGGNNGFVFHGAGGGRATVTIPVQPGEQLIIVVGGQGVDSSTINCILGDGDDGPTVGDGQGGFNGGGSGGNPGSGCSGAGGGGASDVRRVNTSLGDRIIVAGGGGGAAANPSCSSAGGGGGLNGGSADCVPLGGGGQDGGTGSGVLGQGSNGADDSDGLGGGGGGGYYGGAGGPGNRGGGGGSGFGPADTAFQTGVRSGNGLVTIAFGAAPTVTGINPNIGPARGLFTSTITGTNFVPGHTSFTFGGTPSPQVTCESTTVCSVMAPAGSGTVSVRATANGQQSLDTPADDYTYIDLPTITSISPPAGPEGTVITIEGTNFFPPPWTTLVVFPGNEAVAATCPSFTQCTAVTPPGVGTVTVFVSTQSGPSNSVPFTMTPGVTSISPAGGPAAGNTAITITGTGFDTAQGKTDVQFGSAAALAVGCASATRCTAVSPPGSGRVDVRVTVSGVQSLDTPADDFTYAAAEPPPDPSDDLAALEDAARDAGRLGSTLARLAARAGAAVDDGRTMSACIALRVFLIVVRVGGAVGHLDVIQVAQLSTHATRIRTTLGCR